MKGKITRVANDKLEQHAARFFKKREVNKLGRWSSGCNETDEHGRGKSINWGDNVIQQGNKTDLQEKIKEGQLDFFFQYKFKMNAKGNLLSTEKETDSP